MTAYGNGTVVMYGKSHVTAALSANHPEVGTIMQDGDEVYQWVYNDGGSTIGVGQGCIVSALTGYSVTVSSTTNLDFAIGIVKHVAIPTLNYGWVLKRGFGPCKAPANSGIAAAAMLTLGADGVISDVQAVATGLTGNRIGKCMVATASGGTGDAYYSIY